MNDWKTLKDQGNAWKLVYAAYVAVENAPEDVVGYTEDEYGNGYEEIFHYCSDDLKHSLQGKNEDEIGFDHLRYSQALGAFINDCDSGKAAFPFTYQSYLEDKNIKETIKGFDLDVEQFWYALLFIYWLTQIRCVNVHKPKGAMGEQMQKLIEYLDGIDSFTISTEGKKKLVIDDVGVMSSIRDFLQKKMNEDEFGANHGYSFKLNSQNEHLESASVQMWFAATRFQKLFENLELSEKRAKDSEVKYVYDPIYQKRVAVGGGKRTVSYNKMRLISRLMYFMKFTRNESFLIDENALKGILKQYKGYKLNTVNPSYLL